MTLVELTRVVNDLPRETLAGKPFGGPIALPFPDFIQAVKDLEEQLAAEGRVMLHGRAPDGSYGPLFRGCVLTLAP